MLYPMGCSFPCCFDGCYSCCILGSEPSLGPLRSPEELCLLMFCCLLCSVLPGSSSWLLLSCTLDLGWSPYLSVCYPAKKEREISLKSALWCLHRCTQMANIIDISHKSLPKIVPVEIVMKTGNGGGSETLSYIGVVFAKAARESPVVSVLPAYFFHALQEWSPLPKRILKVIHFKEQWVSVITTGKSWAKALMAIIWRLFSWRSR